MCGVFRMVIPIGNGIRSVEVADKTDMVSVIGSGFCFKIAIREFHAAKFVRISCACA